MAKSGFAHANRLQLLNGQLVKQWSASLVKLQIKELDSPGLKGGLLSPAYGRIEGRCAEAVYPFLYMANRYNDDRYVESSVLLFNWAENNVCFPDGSWVNEVSISDWRGVTVNAVIALGEALKNHGSVLSKKDYQKWTKRLRLSAEYVYRNIDVGYGNINYPIVASYAMVLVGQLLNEPKYIKRADYLAQKVISFFTGKDKLLFGEGTPYHLKSSKGCYALDLGYNVEESLPALALYGILANNNDVLDVLTQSLKAHLEFMLPDGAWDNSWGTRNYKWTYWGSRNSDGCQPAYALLAHKDERFYEAAYRNTVLLNECTHNGLLQGGLHNEAHGELPSVHHTFCHAKALVTVLDYGVPESSFTESVKLPREEENGVVEFSDIQTWLISKGNVRATITGYDREYEASTHASGGALSMCWHPSTGAVLVAGLTDYRLLEASNMQMDKDENSMSLTPRLELVADGKRYQNSSDLKAEIEYSVHKKHIEFKVHSLLVDGDQNSPVGNPFSVEFTYVFATNSISIEARSLEKEFTGYLNFYLPVISKATDLIHCVSNQEIIIEREAAHIYIHSDTTMSIAPSINQHVFNFVPGFEAVPLRIECVKDQPVLFKVSLLIVSKEKKTKEYKSEFIF